MSKRKKKQPGPSNGERALEIAGRKMEERIKRLVDEGRGPVALGTVGRWAIKAAFVDPDVMESVQRSAVFASYEIKDLFFGDDPDMRVVFADLGDAYGIPVTGQLDFENDTLILNPFAFIKCPNDKFVELVLTIGHELTHRWCERRGIEELTPFIHPEYGVIPYHNEEFKKAAESHGQVCAMNVDGYSDTNFSERSWTRIKQRCPLTRECMLDFQQHPW